MVSGITAAIVVSTLFFGLCFVFLYDCWVLMFSGFIGESMAQTIDATGSFCSATAYWCYSAIAHCSVVYYMPRAQCFFLAFLFVFAILPIFRFCLSSILCVSVCVWVHAAHTIEIYTPTHFSPLPKKMPNKNRFSLDTNAHKQKIGRFFSVHRFISFPFFLRSFFICCDNALQYFCYVCMCVCAYVLCDLRTIRLFLSRKNQDVFYTYIEHLQTRCTLTTNIVYSRS